MPLYWAEIELEFFDWDLGRLESFYFDELLLLFKDSKIDEKAARFKVELESEFRNRAIVEGWSSEIEEEELADYLHDQTADFYHDHEVLKREFSALISVQIVRLLERFVRKLLVRVAAKGEALPTRMKDVINRYKSAGVDVRAIPSYKRVEPLWLVNNVYKHAEGDSKMQLKKIRPDLFERDPIEGDVLVVESAQARDFFDGAELFSREFVKVIAKFRGT